MAKDLAPRDRVLVKAGEARVIHTHKLNHEQFVYNFTVSDLNNYFVGESGVWVHNELTKDCGSGDGARDTPKLNIAERLNDLRQQGHAPQRHGGQITKQQLNDRAVDGKDPITGTIWDAYRKNSDGTPKKHNYSAHATRFTSDEALVLSDFNIRNSEAFKSEMLNAQDGVFVVKRPASEVLGAGYLDDIQGVSRLGTKANPTGWQDTNLTNANIRAVYKIEDNGNISLITMFPDPV